MAKVKCDHCNKKLGLIVYTCECNHKFCSQHRYKHSHNCSLDSKSQAKKNIQKNNQKVVPSKVQTI
jgi:predicted nucleic acid binding AN1-type Zn finger protein